jgi:ComF family protein
MGIKSHRFELSALRAVSGYVRIAAVTRTAINLIFPQRCFVCGELIDSAGALCADCWGELSFMGPPSCACCGYPFEFAVREGALCAACMKRPPPYSSARSALLYDDASRSLVLAFKHADRTRYADAFGHWLARAGAEFLPQADLLVPVPLHPWRLLRRRYNQSLLLAWGLARLTGCPVVPDMLVRRRNTISQGRLSRRARERNVRSAFKVRVGRKPILQGKTVILIDDVLTTGATVEACARALRAGGAAEVHVLTLARVVRPQAG